MDGSAFNGIDKVVYGAILFVALCCFGSGFLVAKFLN